MAAPLGSALALGRAASAPAAATERPALPAGAGYLAAILSQHFGKLGTERALAVMGDLVKAGYLLVPMHDVDEGEARTAAAAWAAQPAPPEYRDKEWARAAGEDVWGAYETIRTGRQWLAIQTEKLLTLAAVNGAQLAALTSAKALITKPGTFAADLARWELEDSRRKRERRAEKGAEG